MSDSENIHERDLKDQKVFEGEDIIFDCPLCGKNLVVEKIAMGHKVDCPGCHKPIVVPAPHQVVTLAEDPETKKLNEMPPQQQALIAIESAFSEAKNQREEAGNFYKHHSSEANRLLLRIEKNDPALDSGAKDAHQKHLSEAKRLKSLMEKLDARLKDLEAKKKDLK